MILGVDASHYQGEVDWPAVAAAGAEFAWLKATQGTDFVDPRFAANAAGASAAGLKVGAYHFAQMAGPFDDELVHFAETVAGIPAGMLSLPAALDVERRQGLDSFDGPAGAQLWVSAWLDSQHQDTGIEPVLYTDPYVLDSYLLHLRGRPLWLAHWTGHPEAPPLDPAQGSIKIWQFTSKKSIGGKKFDMSRIVDSAWWASIGAAPHPPPAREAGSAARLPAHPAAAARTAAEALNQLADSLEEAE